jgi:hypothetical protein
MKKLVFSITVFLIFINLIFHNAFSEEDKEAHFFSDIPPRASVFGKYQGLKQRLQCADALYKMTYRNNLRNFHDIGYNKDPKTWCDNTLQTGYVVYYGGIWYVWEKQIIKDHPDELLATMNGTYTGLVKKKKCRHMVTKGNFIEFGYIKSPMCDNPNRPDTGFFVYVKPYVYIYKNKVIPLEHVPESVSVDGLYSDLKNVIRCDIQGEQKFEGEKMKDSRVVLQYDEEEQRSRLWTDMCSESLGEGHYVYRYPYWYAWGEKKISEY